MKAELHTQHTVGHTVLKLALLGGFLLGCVYMTLVGLANVLKLLQ